MNKYADLIETTKSRRHKRLNNKAKRREQAEARQEQRDARTPQQQLERLDKGGFAAKRERARLIKQIN